MTEKSLKRSCERTQKNAILTEKSLKRRKDRTMATIKELLGENYKDGMTAEQLLSTDLGDLVQRSQFDGFVPKATLDKAMADASDWKNKFRQTQSEADRQAAELAEQNKQRDDELKQLRRDKQVSDLTSKFISQGYDEELAKSSAVATIDNDYNTVFTNMAKFTESVKQKNISQNQNKTPAPPINNSVQNKKVDVSEMSPYEYIQYQNEQAAEANN